MPRPLDLDRLAAFTTEPAAPKMQESALPTVPPTPVRWPSREQAPNDAQVSVKAPGAVINRFRTLCEINGRRTYAEMLVLLMDRWEEGSGQG
ncbi:hypothetical protein ACN9JG_23010 (plasmid) [Cereibacter azotoformans]|uniref:hypothetical protein n=1 Tax=Cereibacter azotoformans TaxID=43057 RepID=UPI003B22065D